MNWNSSAQAAFSRERNTRFNFRPPGRPAPSHGLALNAVQPPLILRDHVKTKKEKIETEVQTTARVLQQTKHPTSCETPQLCTQWSLPSPSLEPHYCRVLKATTAHNRGSAVPVGPIAYITATVSPFRPHLLLPCRVVLSSAPLYAPTCTRTRSLALRDLSDASYRRAAAAVTRAHEILNYVPDGPSGSSKRDCSPMR